MDKYHYKYIKYKNKYNELKGGTEMNVKKELQKYLNLAEKNNHIELLYKITKQTVEADGIDESYITSIDYDQKAFSNEVNQIKEEKNFEKYVNTWGDSYLKRAGLPIYKILLDQKIIK